MIKRNSYISFIRLTVKMLSLAKKNFEKTFIHYIKTINAKSSLSLSCGLHLCSHTLKISTELSLTVFRFSKNPSHTCVLYALLRFHLKKRPLDLGKQRQSIKTKQNKKTHHMFQINSKPETTGINFLLFIME